MTTVDPSVLQELRRLTALEADAVATARERAGDDAAPPEIGALLAWLAVGEQVATAVEVGASGGLTGLWLVPALRGRQVLTSIEPDPYAHSLATDAFAAGGITEHVRSILGDPSTVLPRLSDAAYDLVLLQGEPAHAVDHLDHAARMLRPGGLVVVRGVAQPGEHAEASTALLAHLLDLEVFDTVVLPIDDGLALGRRRDDAVDDDGAAHAR